MAIALPNSLFIHIPKTGGTWVTHALQKAKIPIHLHPCDWHPPSMHHIAGHTCTHSSVRDHSLSSKKTFCFVRHPFTYYQSFWSYKMKVGWNMQDAFDAQFKSNIFADFVRTIITTTPKGWFQCMIMDHAMHQNGNFVDYIGRQEQLVEDLITILYAAGEQFDECRIRNFPPKNVSSKDKQWSELCVLTDELKNAIYTKERWVFDTFGYSPDDPLDLLRTVPPMQFTPKELQEVVCSAT